MIGHGAITNGSFRRPDGVSASSSLGTKRFRHLIDGALEQHVHEQYISLVFITKARV